jgi:hypothetical protein
MTRRVLRALHAITLGLMVFLAGASNCFSQSYDPDPWDNTPPVTVDFDYLIPHLVSVEATSEGVTITHSGISPTALLLGGEVQLDRAIRFVADDDPGNAQFCSVPLRR